MDRSEWDEWEPGVDISALDEANEEGEAILNDYLGGSCSKTKTESNSSRCGLVDPSAWIHQNPWGFYGEKEEREESERLQRLEIHDARAIEFLRSGIMNIEEAKISAELALNFFEKLPREEKVRYIIKRWCLEDEHISKALEKARGW